MHHLIKQMIINQLESVIVTKSNLVLIIQLDSKPVETFEPSNVLSTEFDY